jgi:hypothetical protein
MKRLAKFFESIFKTPKSSLEEYITMNRPQNHSDLDRIVREWNELRMW